MNNFNMETEVDQYAYQFQEISFCQTKPIRVQKEGQIVWYMAKEWQRTISRIAVCDSQYEKCIDRFLSGISLCELAVSSGVPILQTFATKMLDLSNYARPIASVDRMPAAKSGNLIEPKDILDITRADFEIAFGITPLQQLRIESTLAGNLTNTPVCSDYLKKYKNFTKINQNE
jgi:hypothetical protein